MEDIKRQGPKGFLFYYKNAIIRPDYAFFNLVSDLRKIRLGFLAVLIQAIIYTLVYVFLVFGKGSPYHPWLNIPPDQYYRYNVFFLAPSMLLGWILSAAVVHVITRSFLNRGSFEGLLATFGFGIGIASWSTGFHDLLTSLLGAALIIDQHQYEIMLNSPTIWRILLWAQMGIYVTWFIVLFSLGVRINYRIGKVQSVALGILAFILYQGFFLIFNR